jgi:hypothetical protein
LLFLLVVVVLLLLLLLVVRRQKLGVLCVCRGGLEQGRDCTAPCVICSSSSSSSSGTADGRCVKKWQVKDTSQGFGGCYRGITIPSKPPTPHPTLLLLRI